MVSERVRVQPGRHYPESFDERQEDSADGGAAYHRRDSSSGCQHATGEGATQYRVPWVLFRAEMYQGALDRREQAAPNCEIAGYLRHPVFHRHYTAVESSLEAGWRVPKSYDTLYDEEDFDFQN